MMALLGSSACGSPCREAEDSASRPMLLCAPALRQRHWSQRENAPFASGGDESGAAPGLAARVRLAGNGAGLAPGSNDSGGPNGAGGTPELGAERSSRWV